MTSELQKPFVPVESNLTVDRQYAQINSEFCNLGRMHGLLNDDFSPSTSISSGKEINSTEGCLAQVYDYEEKDQEDCILTGELGRVLPVLEELSKVSMEVIMLEDEKHEGKLAERIIAEYKMFDDGVKMLESLRDDLEYLISSAPLIKNALQEPKRSDALPIPRDLHGTAISCLETLTQFHNKFFHNVQLLQKSKLIDWRAALDKMNEDCVQDGRQLALLSNYLYHISNFRSKIQDFSQRKLDEEN